MYRRSENGVQVNFTVKMKCAVNLPNLFSQNSVYESGVEWVRTFVKLGIKLQVKQSCLPEGEGGCQILSQICVTSFLKGP